MFSIGDINCLIVCSFSPELLSTIFIGLRLSDQIWTYVFQNYLEVLFFNFQNFYFWPLKWWKFIFWYADLSNKITLHTNHLFELLGSKYLHSAQISIIDRLTGNAPRIWMKFLKNTSTIKYFTIGYANLYCVYQLYFNKKSNNKDLIFSLNF